MSTAAAAASDVLDVDEGGGTVARHAEPAASRIHGVNGHQMELHEPRWPQNGEVKAGVHEVVVDLAVPTAIAPAACAVGAPYRQCDDVSYTGPLGGIDGRLLPLHLVRTRW